MPGAPHQPGNEKLERLARRAYASLPPRPDELRAVEARVIGATSRPSAPPLWVQWVLGSSLAAATVAAAFLLRPAPAAVLEPDVAVNERPETRPEAPARPPLRARPRPLHLLTEVEAGPIDADALERQRPALAAALRRCLGEASALEVSISVDEEGRPLTIRSSGQEACIQRALIARRFPVSTGGPVAGEQLGPVGRIRITLGIRGEAR